VHACLCVYVCVLMRLWVHICEYECVCVYVSTMIHIKCNVLS